VGACMTKCVEKSRNTPAKRITRYALLILPAVALGVLGMILTGVKPMLWGQQIAACFAFALLAYVLCSAVRKISPAVCAAVMVLLLAAALLGEEAGGARRWLDLSVFNVNAAMLVIPALIILLDSMRCPYPAMICAAAVLCVQPDLSQLTAFVLASVPVLWRSRNKKVWMVVSAAAFSAFVVVCLNIPIRIEPVPYCEGVLTMLGEISWLMMAAGGMSLALIPGFWAYRFLMVKHAWMLSLGVYYIVIILFGLSGQYPVPFMGFGLSPIAGYWLAYLFVPPEEIKMN